MAGDTVSPTPAASAGPSYWISSFSPVTVADSPASSSGAITVVVLKGPGTVVAGPDGRCRVNTTGNCGMAKGGSGDVLSGVVLALLGLGMDAFDACCCAVWLHGRAGDLAAQEKGQWGMTPTDLLERLPQALREVTE